jgi:pyrroline-5-carboxylate reductase
MNLLFIGGGNMASALIGGLASGHVSLQSIHVIEPAEAARDHLLSRFTSVLRGHGIQFSVDARSCPAEFSIAPEKTWVILAVKPQHLQDACTNAHASVRQCLEEARILSIAAGIATQAITEWTGNARIVRAMPNTPALVNRGMTGLYAPTALNDQAKAQAEQLMAAVGSVVWVAEEALMDAVTALSGSGPAYVFRFIEALSAAGVTLGLTAAQSHQLTIETLEGALMLLKSSGEAPAALREKVTSKGGTTAAALGSLDQHNFMKIISAALTAARDRSVQMSREFKDQAAGRSQ